MTTPYDNKPKPNKKGQLHRRNPHHGRYDIPALCKAYPALTELIISNPRGEQTINFSDPVSVRALNKALLANDYGVHHWMVPDDYLCPPIPGRADYLHYVADILSGGDDAKIPRGAQVKVLDIGTGANCVYPIIGQRSFGWQFVGTDVDKTALEAARVIVGANKVLKDKIALRLQADAKCFFKNIIAEGEHFDVSICNPPFHASEQEAANSHTRKVANLTKNPYGAAQAPRNFGGNRSELWCPGGELDFIKNMIRESQAYANQINWFTTLVSKSENIRPLKKLLNSLSATKIEVIEMSQGQKISRILVWCFNAR